MSMSSPFLRLLLVGLFSVLLTPLANAEAAKRLRIGITLHPYYSYVANIVGDKAEVVPLILKLCAPGVSNARKLQYCCSSDL